jgi:ubiquinone/menaquinone biosynthesis C-methylase UbiE
MVPAPTSRSPVSTEANDSRTFKQRDASSYDTHIASFGRFTERFSRDTAGRMVELAGLDPGSRVLDVGTGTGVVALEAARSTGPAARVVGIDLSASMLAAASEKATAAGYGERVVFQRQDAEALAHPDACFDAVLSLYALLHFPEPVTAIGEMFRVLRPGGRLVLAIGSSPPLLSALGLIHVLRRLPLLMRQLSGRCLAAPAFLDDLVSTHLPAGSEPEESELARSHVRPAAIVREMVEAAGFVAPQVATSAYAAEIETPEEFWDLQVTFSSFARKRIEAARLEQVEDLKRLFLARCRDVKRRGGTLTYPYSAYIVSARRP